ncbi:MAG: hypothetical protein ABMA14_11375 [Hyphomonadaceae bacterium]
MMNAIEDRATEIETACVDERVPALSAAVKSARLIIEMSARNADTATLLMPCVYATILHVRSELLLVACSLRSRTTDERDLRQPPAAIMTPGRPA